MDNSILWCNTRKHKIVLPLQRWASSDIISWRWCCHPIPEVIEGEMMAILVSANGLYPAPSAFALLPNSVKIYHQYRPMKMIVSKGLSEAKQGIPPLKWHRLLSHGKGSEALVDHCLTFQPQPKIPVHFLLSWQRTPPGFSYKYQCPVFTNTDHFFRVPIIASMVALPLIEN